MSDEENPAVRICSLPHCDEQAGSGCCTGTTSHFLCDSCFCGYASSQFDAVGAFERERTSSNNIVSAPGELPCYLFLTNECECASIPSTTLARVLSTDPIALEAYESAKRRLIQAQHDQEQAENGAAQVQREQESTPVEKLQQVIVDALSRGGYVPCPECGQHGQKNDACMHMRCPCGTRYCYCCGRQRGDGTENCRSDGSGCDYPSPYLENHPGWNEFSLNEEESAGLGALHEFHRRRMAYFLRQVKVNYPAELWDQLRQEHRNLLDATPTDGRCIEWDEINTAEPPLFGNTRVEQLEWEDGGVHACAERVVEEQQRQEQAPKRQRRRQRQRPGLACEEYKISAAIWIVGFILAIIVLSLGAGSDSQALRTVGNILIAVLVGTGLPVVSMYIVDYFAANPQQGCIREVQCIRGRNDELPYLAKDGGRWSRRRAIYFFIFFCGIALASVCLANKDIIFLHAFGVFLLTVILLSYCGITVLVNAIILPEQQPLRSRFEHFMIRLCIFGAIFSIGVGLLTVYNDTYSGNVSGKVFFAIGFAGALAELLPRVVQVWLDLSRFTRTPDTYRLVLSYLFCEGLAVGSLMVGISDGGPINAVGISILVVSIVIACPLFFARFDQ